MGFLCEGEYCTVGHIFRFPPKYPKVLSDYYHVVWFKAPTIFRCNANVAFPSCFALLKFTALVEQRLTKISSEILIVVTKSLRMKSVRKCIKLLLMAEILHHLG